MNIRSQAEKVIPILAGVFVGLLILAPMASASRLSDEAKRCGGELNTIEADIQLPAAREVWKVLPALGISPELEENDRPARLIVFKGDYDSSGIAFAGDVPAKFSQVICVVLDDGTVYIYRNVPRNGSSFSN